MKQGPTTITLHLKEASSRHPGPHIRMCTECAVRLWIPADGTWTDVREIWENPPDGYVSCRDVR